MLVSEIWQRLTAILLYNAVIIKIYAIRAAIFRGFRKTAKSDY